jgi:two-component system cell cycle response regulator
MEKESLRILLVDSYPQDHCVVEAALKSSEIPIRIQVSPTTPIAIEELKAKDFDIILSDHSPPEVNAFHLLRWSGDRRLPSPIILLTRNSQIQTAREAFRRGAADYLLKEELKAISLIDLITSVIARFTLSQEVVKDQERWRDEAARDGLTGLFNDRFLIQVAEKELARVRRYGHPLSLLMIDLDGFKAINDNCGHLKGDQILKSVANLLQQSVRSVDAVARYGGDEFAILLPETDQEHAILIGERILHEVRRHPYLDQNRFYPLSASLGIASTEAGITRSLDLIEQADRALYDAKRSGRNRVSSSRRKDKRARDESFETQLVLGKPLL